MRVPVVAGLSGLPGGTVLDDVPVEEGADLAEVWSRAVFVFLADDSEFFEFLACWERLEVPLRFFSLICCELIFVAEELKNSISEHNPGSVTRADSPPDAALS